MARTATQPRRRLLGPQRTEAYPTTSNRAEEEIHQARGIVVDARRQFAERALRAEAERHMAEIAKSVETASERLFTVRNSQPSYVELSLAIQAAEGAIVQAETAGFYETDFLAREVRTAYAELSAMQDPARYISQEALDVPGPAIRVVNKVQARIESVDPALLEVPEPATYLANQRKAALASVDPALLEVPEPEAYLAMQESAQTEEVAKPSFFQSLVSSIKSGARTIGGRIKNFFMERAIERRFFAEGEAF